MCISPTISAIAARCDIANPPDPSWPCLTHVEPVYDPDGVEVVAVAPRRHPRRCTQAEHDALERFDARCAAIRDGRQP